MLEFNANGMVAQRFPFPKPIMDYILENVQPHHLVKLYPTCKFFYNKYRRNIIQNLKIVGLNSDENEILDPNFSTLKILNDVLEEIAERFCITNSLIVTAPNSFFFLQELIHCQIKKLECGCPLSWGEFVTVAEAKTIVEIKVQSIDHMVEDGFAFFEDILEMLPNCKSIEIENTRFNDETCQKIMRMKLGSKLDILVLKNCEPFQHFDLATFINFVTMNAETVCNVEITFKLVDVNVPVDAVFNQFLIRIGLYYTAEIYEALGNVAAAGE